MKVLCIRITGVAVALGAAAGAQTTDLESRTAVAGNSYSTEAAISSDGRYVAFASNASNLVAGDTNGGEDIFVQDTLTGAIELVSVSTAGVQSNGLSELPRISADGRFVVYDSSASNLVAGDTNGATDIFLRDRQNGTTEIVSLSSGSVLGNGASVAASVSADGRFVAFQSSASNLVPGDTNAGNDIFVRDRQTGTTERVSVGPGGAQANGISLSPTISADGRYVVFSSDATNLVAGDTNGQRDVFVRDRQAGTTLRVSVGAGGVQANFPSNAPVGVSADGRYICFESDATNLVAGDTNGMRDVFVRDMQAGTNEIASVSTGGTQGDSTSWASQISPDGRFVVFASYATTLVAGDTNGFEDVFVRDRQNGTTVLASLGWTGAQGNGNPVPDPSISADGNRVAFASNASNLVLYDTNGNLDVFLRDIAAGATKLVSGFPRTGDGGSEAPVVSADGRLVAFESTANDLVPGDANNASDIFVADRSNGTIERVSVAMGGGDANGASHIPVMTPDGRYVAFSSNATNIAAGNMFGNYQVFLCDRQLGTTVLVSDFGSGGYDSGYLGVASGSLGLSITSDGRYVAFAGAPCCNQGGFGFVYLWDRQTGIIEYVSVSSTGATANDDSESPSVSADGRYVAFSSVAANLVSGDTNHTYDIFLRDRQAGTTTRVNVGSGGAQANGGSGIPTISANGRFVVFASDATNLVAADTNGQADEFVRDLQTGTTELVSVSSSGLQANARSGYPTSISSDGRFVLFSSAASNLVGGDTNGMGDVFLRDRLLKTTTLVSVSTAGAQGNGTSGTFNNDFEIQTSISPDGRYVAFASLASNFAFDDPNGAADVFFRDRGAASDFAAFCFGDGTGAACPCANSGAPGHGCENSSTTGGAILGASGTASLSADSVVLTSSGEKPTATSVLLSGTTTVNSLHYGDGLRCVGGTLKRLYTHNAVGGVVTMPQGADASVSARSTAIGDVIQLGATRVYQVYYRDPSATFCPTPSGSTFNISNAIAIAWGE